MTAIICPACFARDIDPIRLHFDARDGEYYCVKCCYHGTEDQARAFLRSLQQQRYGIDIAAKEPSERE
jgi:hypothetical protein